MPSASVAPAPAKGRTVTGFVSDESGDPLPGASIALKGTKIGTVTDLNGLFSLVIPADFTNPQIEVSFVGMVSQTISVRGDKPLNIELSYNSSDLDEVVVIGYGTSKVRDLTGSVSRLTARDVEHSPMTSNVASMLQGKAAGVNVMISSASPTSPISVVIRGQSSLSGDGQPLWVIDGVPQYSSGVSGDVSNTLYNLNLNDVSSIDILKDASATAIYGSRAANGVVIVTTKSGSEGMKPTIEFSTRLGWQSINSNDFKTMDADQYKAFSKQANLLEAFRSGGLSYFNKKYMDQDKFNLITTSQWDMSDIADMWLPNAYYDGHDNYWDAMTQSALAELNRMRQSYTNPVLAPVTGIATHQELMDAIFKEYVVTLLMENETPWFASLRFEHDGRPWIRTLKPEVDFSENQYCWPIPDAEIIAHLNKIDQNPGLE